MLAQENNISKSIRADYANPNQIAHKVLADRMAERDPGNKPMVNDRIPFVYIERVVLKLLILSFYLEIQA